MRELSTSDKIEIILKAAGFRYGDRVEINGDIVTDYGKGYCEDYGSHANNETYWVLGSWNDKTRPLADGYWKVIDDTPSRLARALEFIGVECEWSDEWSPCAECYRLIRTAPDCYSWTLQAVWGEDGYVCTDCAKKDPGAYIGDFINDPEKAITWLDESDLEDLGFLKWGASDDYPEGETFHAGWYGREDKPDTILGNIQAEHPEAEVVFLLDGTGQFEISFSAWYRAD